VIYSVGGGGTERKISANIVHAIVLAKAHSAKVFDIVGRDSGSAAKHYDLVLAHRGGQSELVIRGFPGCGLALPGLPSSLAAEADGMVSGTHAMRPAVFLDRDGVIVVPQFRDGRSFAPRRLKDFRLYPDAAASLQRLKQAGFLLVVVTNQSGVRNGLISRSDVDAMHEMMARELPLDTIKACFHGQADDCDCRKPKPGMILEAAIEFGINLEKSFIVGDSTSDVEAGRAAGCATVFIDLGYAEPAPTADYIVHSLAEAAHLIIETILPVQEGP
jgi:D-glycero-D-manno-heptose 1,7-bisphosphate phosphatase